MFEIYREEFVLKRKWLRSRDDPVVTVWPSELFCLEAAKPKLEDWKSLFVDLRDESQIVVF